MTWKADLHKHLNDRGADIDLSKIDERLDQCYQILHFISDRMVKRAPFTSRTANVLRDAAEILTLYEEK